MLKPEPPDQFESEHEQESNVFQSNIRYNVEPKVMSNTTSSLDTKETTVLGGKGTVPNTSVVTSDVTKPDPKNGLWISDTAGNPSMSATFAAIAFLITTAVYILSIFESIGPFKIRSFDAAACSSYLIPSLGLYFGRRWTTEK